MSGTPKVGDDADEHEDRLNALTQKYQERLQEHAPTARLHARCLEGCHFCLNHVEKFFSLGFYLRLRCTRADRLFQCVELVLREVRALGGDPAAHSTLQTVLFIDAVVDIIDGILCPLRIA